VSVVSPTDRKAGQQELGLRRSADPDLSLRCHSAPCWRKHTPLRIPPGTSAERSARFRSRFGKSRDPPAALVLPATVRCQQPPRIERVPASPGRMPPVLAQRIRLDFAKRSQRRGDVRRIRACRFSRRRIGTLADPAWKEVFCPDYQCRTTDRPHRCRPSLQPAFSRLPRWPPLSSGPVSTMIIRSRTGHEHKSGPNWDGTPASIG